MENVFIDSTNQSLVQHLEGLEQEYKKTKSEKRYAILDLLIYLVSEQNKVPFMTQRIIL